MHDQMNTSTVLVLVFFQPILPAKARVGGNPIPNPRRPSFFSTSPSLCGFPLPLLLAKPRLVLFRGCMHELMGINDASGGLYKSISGSAVDACRAKSLLSL